VNERMRERVNSVGRSGEANGEGLDGGEVFKLRRQKQETITNYLTICSSRGPSREKNLLIPAAAGSPPSMPLLVVWPHAGAFGASAILLGLTRVW